MKTYTETHTVTFVKPAKRSLRDDVITGNFTALFNSILSKSMTVRGWSITEAVRDTDTGASFYTREESGEAEFPYTYRAFALVTFSREDGKTPNADELASFIRTLYTRAGQPNFGKWNLAELDGKPYEVSDEDGISGNITSEMIGYVDVSIPEDWESYFAHLYGRNAHIGRIRGAIEAGITSDFNNRFHCALVGPPGCGKSDICRSLQKALGEEAVMEYDATAMTGAGAIKDLSEREILPRILVVEEIEKADEKSLAFLLGLMDMRGEIRKTTARTKIQRDTKLLVIATVNNYEKFKSMNAGALESRFSNKLGFSRPSREQLAMILTREVAKINGNTDWIKPTLDYCEDHSITDPRQVISLALCGRDAWLDGSYAEMLAETVIDEAELA
jgi:ATPase family associated with various cellular activities (AAA)